MEAFALIEVIIGLVFVILLLSIIVSLVNEIIVTNFKVRPRLLKKSIGRLLDDSIEDKALSEKFYKHPLINKLTKKETSIPSYISPSTFSKVLIDILKDNDKQPLNDAINNLPEGSGTKVALLTLLNDAEDKTPAFKTNIEDWFNESMNRLSGKFKRNTQVQLFVIGLFAAVVLNVNVIYIAQEISDNKEKRTQLVDAAYSLTKNNKEELTLDYKNLQEIYKTSKEGLFVSRVNPNDSIEPTNQLMVDSIAEEMEKTAEEINSHNHQLEDYEGEMASINKSTNKFSGLVGIFWQDYIKITHKGSEDESFLHRFGEAFDFSWIIGWLIAALGASLGSSFWFDILKKLINFRGTVKPENNK